MTVINKVGMDIMILLPYMNKAFEYGGAGAASTIVCFNKIGMTFWVSIVGTNTKVDQSFSLLKGVGAKHHTKPDGTVFLPEQVSLIIVIRANRRWITF